MLAISAWSSYNNKAQAVQNEKFRQEQTRWKQTRWGICRAAAQLTSP